MKALEALSKDDLRGLRSLAGILFDLDDTLLSHGVLTRAAYDALWDLRDAGLRLVAVTGRPSGWGEVIARQWPIDGAVTENGAVVIAREGSGVARFERCDDVERRTRRARLARIVEGVREAVPEARLTDDVDARRADVTWDIGERVRLPEDRVAAIVRMIAAAGARSFASSVHVHATYDTDDKASGAVAYLARAFGEDPGAVTGARWAFVGDSGNDAACFSAFRTTFAVANVRSHLARIPVTPRYVARAEMGEGFAEIARTIVASRTA
ncbi:MAG: HAD family hydrolase [Polyangiaceae bacterium]